jgi:hypothetical protein
LGAEHGELVMIAPADPVSVLQRAWCELRLAKLQRLVTETITLLNAVDPERLLGRKLEEIETTLRGNPITDALEACRAELREECGMLHSSAQRASHGELVRRHMADSPKWAAAFREALEKYRGLAGKMLELACHDLPAEVALNDA